MPWIVPLVTTAYSVYSTANAASKAKKAERELEGMQSPTYTPNQSILNYYNEALRRYNVNPSDTREYKANEQGIKQGTIQALSSLRDRRSSGLIPTVIQGQNNALLKAAALAEQRKAQEFTTLGNATQMKAGEGAKEFQFNKIFPFETKYNLLAMKAAGQNQVANQSIQNAFNNLSGALSLAPEMPSQAEKFGARFGEQGGSAYNWAKANNMNFGQYKRLGNKIGNKLFI